MKHLGGICTLTLTRQTRPASPLARKSRGLYQNMILIFNIGSTSIKYKIFEKPSLRVVESFSVSGFSKFETQLASLFESLKTYSFGLIGHRVVHGGSVYHQPTLITES